MPDILPGMYCLIGPMSRKYHRRRHYLPRGVVKAMRLLGFRYDPGRDAYILVLIGDHVGPVIKTWH